MAQAHTTTGRYGTAYEDDGDDSGRAGSRWRDGRTWRRGWVLAALAVAAGLLMLLHRQVPNAVGNLGSLLETFLPWVGLAVPVLLILALLRRSATALVALVVPVAAWLSLFGSLLGAKSAAPAPGELTVLTHNVDAGNADPAATARAIAHDGGDLHRGKAARPVEPFGKDGADRAVGFALARDQVRVGRADDAVDDFRVARDDRRKGLDRTFEPFAWSEQPESQQYGAA